MAHDREPEPGATGGTATCPVDSIEPLEDAIQIALRDADALVRDRDLDRAVATPGANLHARSGLAVLDRVLDQVPDGGDQLTVVTGHHEPLGSGTLDRRQGRDRDVRLRRELGHPLDSAAD